MNVALFSSEAASTMAARRLVREAGVNHLETLEVIGKLMTPTIQRITDRRKISRDEIGPVMAALQLRLRECRNVLALFFWRRSASVQARLSSNETYDIRFVFKANVTSGEKHLDFVAVSATLDKRKLVIRICQTGFKISDHVVMRWMTREQRAAPEFFDDLLRCLRMAIPFGTATCVTPSRNIAIPHRGGLLLGQTYVVKEEDCDFLRPLEISYTREGSKNTHLPITSLSAGFGYLYNLRTYIDESSLSQSKAALSAQLRDYEEKHTRALHNCFEAVSYGGVNRPRDLTDAVLQAEVRDAVRDANIMVKGNVWRRWSESVGSEGVC